MKQLLQEIKLFMAEGVFPTKQILQIDGIMSKINKEIQKLEQSEKVAKDIIDGAKAGEEIAKRENSQNLANSKVSETKAK